MTPGATGAPAGAGQTDSADTDRGATQAKRRPRDPMHTLAGCERIVVVGRTGSGKTTLARELAAALGVAHVELDSLYFGPQFDTAALDLLRERTIAALAGARWVTDGNKRAVRDLVWPRADTIIWFDYSLRASLWRLAKRARWPTSELRAEAARTRRRAALPRQLLAAAKGVLTALRSQCGPAPRVPAAVRRAGERASRGRAPLVAGCHPRVAGTRYRGVDRSFLIRSTVTSATRPDSAGMHCPPSGSSVADAPVP